MAGQEPSGRVATPSIFWIYLSRQLCTLYNERLMAKFSLAVTQSHDEKDEVAR